MSEEVIVRLGAPTLAGIKTGSLFTCAYTSRKSVEESLRQLNRCFAPKGLCLLPLRYSEKKRSPLSVPPGGAFPRSAKQ